MSEPRHIRNLSAEWELLGVPDRDCPTLEPGKVHYRGLVLKAAREEIRINPCAICGAMSVTREKSK